MYIVKVKMCLDCKGVQNERDLCSIYEYIRDILSPVLSFLSKEKGNNSFYLSTSLFDKHFSLLKVFQISNPVATTNVLRFI